VLCHFYRILKTRINPIDGIALLSDFHGYDRVSLVCVVFKFGEHVKKSLFNDYPVATISVNARDYQNK